MLKRFDAWKIQVAIQYLVSEIYIDTTSTYGIIENMQWPSVIHIIAAYKIVKQ